MSEHYAIRRAIVRNGVDRYVPVHATVSAALAEPRHTPSRQRARVKLLPEPASLKRSRDVVAEQLTAWSQDELVPVAKVIVTALVENVLAHTDSAPSVRVETTGVTVTIAVARLQPSPAERVRNAVRAGGVQPGGAAG